MPERKRPVPPVGWQNIRKRDLRTSRSSAEVSRAGYRQGIPLRKIANFITFQAAWFAAVLGAAHGMPWLGVVAVPLALALHLALSPDWRPELLLALAAAVTGFVFDSILIAAGMFSPVPYILPSPFSSLWMVMLWVNLATTMNVSMGWLRGRYVLGLVFGAIGGPLAYYSGAKLGAMTRLPDPRGLLGTGIAWAIALPLLLVVNERLQKRAKGM